MEINLASKKIFLTGSFVTLGIFLCLPSRISSWFDGLPWSNGVETVSTALIIPLLVFVGRAFLSKRVTFLILISLLALKSVQFIGAPEAGWQIKVFPSLQTSEKGDFTRTYSTVWQEGVSGILKRPWTDKKDFPLDWFLPLLKTTESKDFNIITGPIEEKFNNLSLWLSVYGSFRLPQSTKLVILTQGTGQEYIQAVSKKGETFAIPIAHKLEEVSELAKPFSSEVDWSISGKLEYIGSTWAFQPLLVDQEGAVTSAFGKGALWQNSSVFSFTDQKLLRHQFLSKVIDYGFLIFLAIWFIWSMRQLWARQILTLPLIIWSTTATLLPWILAPLASKLVWLLFAKKILSTPLNPQYLAISICVACIGIMACSHSRPDLRLDRYQHFGTKVFLLFGPALLSYFTIRWWPQLERISLWPLGDDHTAYQSFARLIVVEGQLLTAGEPIFRYNPFYRYIAAFFHWLFGPSAIAQRLADVWFILGAASMLASISRKLQISAFFSILIPMALTITYLAGDYWHHIGWGLAEYSAMFFLVSAIYYLSLGSGSLATVLTAGVFAVIGFWLRLDHIGVLAGIVFFLIEPEKGSCSMVWKDFIHKVKMNLKPIAVYLGVLGSGFLILMLRNWFAGGQFVIHSSNHPNFSKAVTLENFYYIFAGGNKFSSGPSLGLLAVPSLTLLLGTILGLTALIWRPWPLARLPLSIGITLTGLLSVYFFLHAWGYPPRYSIHLLPITVLTLGVILDTCWKRFQASSPLP